MKGAVAAACVALVSGSAQGQGSFYGRWARDQAACTADGLMAPLVITAQALQWPDTVCTVRRSYRVGDAWHVGAYCMDAATDLTITFALAGEHLRVLAGGGVMELRRCP